MLAPRNLCSGSNEASGHLRDEETKQAQKGGTVDVARNEAEEERSRSYLRGCSILLLSHGGAFHTSP